MSNNKKLEIKKGFVRSETIMGRRFDIIFMEEYNVGALLVNDGKEESPHVLFVENWKDDMEHKFLEAEAVKKFFEINEKLNPNLINNDLYKALNEDK